VVVPIAIIDNFINNRIQEIVLYTEPYVVTVSGAAKSLNRTGTGPDTGAFATADRAYRVSVNHTYGRRVRRNIQFIGDTLVANPLISGQNISQSVSVSLTVNHPAGFDTAAMKAHVDGFLAKLSASSGADITKLLGGES
jgi:hypothetical protein